MKEALPIQLDEPAEASIWLRKSPAQWYEKLPATGTILDLVVLLLVLPVLIWDFVCRRGVAKSEDVLCEFAGNELLFFEGSKRKSAAEHLVARFEKASLANLSFQKSHKTKVCFEFDRETFAYYFEGVYSDLEPIPKHLQP